MTPFSPQKSGFFQRKGRKRVKEGREVTFMKEWVKSLYIGYLQALDLSQNAFPFLRTGHLKISLGPTQFLYCKFHGRSKALFIPISTMAPNSSVGRLTDPRRGGNYILYIIYCEKGNYCSPSEERWQGGRKSCPDDCHHH